MKASKITLLRVWIIQRNIIIRYVTISTNIISLFGEAIYIYIYIILHYRKILANCIIYRRRKITPSNRTLFVILFCFPRYCHFISRWFLTSEILNFTKRSFQYILMSRGRWNLRSHFSYFAALENRALRLFAGRSWLFGQRGFPPRWGNFIRASK